MFEIELLLEDVNIPDEFNININVSYDTKNNVVTCQAIDKINGYDITASGRYKMFEERYATLMCVIDKVLRGIFEGNE